ncbi:Tfp structural protein, partial [Candidatus Roizmanbacteria bacterium CG10_big_fil_rev_8_21_14_0_10_39_6]
MKIQKQKKGFTLIELLIVIALLGTLAVALLAAIDPFEQFKKGTDTARRN